MSPRALALPLMAAIVGLMPAAVSVAAHPFHVTLAEAEYNPESGRLEVALKVWPPDLERALELRLDREIDLDKDPDIEERIADYVAAVFRVRTAEGEPVRPKWVGMELDLRDGWLYFEHALPDGPRGLEISNRAFFELEENQVNTVNVRFPGGSGEDQRVTLTLTADRPVGRLP